MPLEINVGPPVLTIHHGSTFMVTDRRGEIEPEQEQGVFAGDTRFVGYYRCTIERQPWHLLTSTTPTYYQARLVYANPELPALDTPLPHVGTRFPGVRGHLPAHTVGLIITRTINGAPSTSYEAVFEEFTLTNYLSHPVSFHFDLAIRSDFIDLFDVKAHRYVARGDVVSTWCQADGYHQLVADYRNEDFTRRCIYRILASDTVPHFANGRITWTLQLPGAGRWHASAVMLLDGTAGAYNVSRRRVAPATAPRRTDPSDWQQTTTRLTSSNGDVVAAFRQAVQDMAALRLHEHDMGPDQWLPAGGVPWFVTLFGRDSLVASYQSMMAFAPFARGALEKLAQYQASERDDWRDAQPGKILHELRRGELAHFHLIPHTPYYGTWDATPLYLIVLHEAWRWTGDRHLLETYRATAERCLRWIDQYGDLDGDGFQEYQTFSSQGYDNMSWKDSGDAVMYPDGTLVRQPKALCELQGYVYDAKRRMAEVFATLGDTARASQLAEQADALRRAFNTRFWLEDQGTYAYALDPAKQPVASVVSNPGHCLWTGIADPDKAARVVRRLLQPDMWSGWGIRTLSAEHAAYNPFSYHNGAVWPHDNAFIAAGFKRYGFVAEANQVARGIFDAASYFESYQLPELFAGLARAETTFPVQYLGANIPQAWAAGSVFLLLRTMLGLRADAPAGRLYVAPTLPAWLPDLELSNLAVGSARLRLRFWREGAATRWEVIQQAGNPIEVVPDTPDAGQRPFYPAPSPRSSHLPCSSKTGQGP